VLDESIPNVCYRFGKKTEDKIHNGTCTHLHRQLEKWCFISKMTTKSSVRHLGGVQFLVGHLFFKMTILYGMAATLNQGCHSEPDVDCQNSTEVQKKIG
jgi:hypothetical protein